MTLSQEQEDPNRDDCYNRPDANRVARHGRVRGGDIRLERPPRDVTVLREGLSERERLGSPAEDSRRTCAFLVETFSHRPKRRLRYATLRACG